MNSNQFDASEAAAVFSDSDSEEDLSLDDSDSPQPSHCSSDQYNESDFEDGPASSDNNSEDEQTNIIPDTWCNVDGSRRK